MKQLLTLCFLLLTALPLRADPADMNLYFMLWPAGEEDAPTATQVIEFEDGQMRMFTHTSNDADQDMLVPADPEHVALVGAAIKAVLLTISTDMGEDVKGDRVAVEWSVSNMNTFERGSTLFAIDSLPPEVLAVQDKVFGARLQP